MNPFIGIGPTITRRRGGGASDLLSPAPTSLTVFAYSDGRCDLTWVNSGGYAIIVQRSTDQESYSTIHTTAEAATTYSDTTCSENTRYFYRVRAVSDGKYSNYSNVATDVTLPTILLDGNTFAYYDYEASSTITKDESNVVSRINDRLGSGNDLVSGSCGYSATDGFTFNGTDQRIYTAAKTLNQPTFIYAVLKQISWTANDRAFDGIAATGTIQQAYATPQFKVNAGADMPSNAPYIPSLALNTWGILRLLLHGSSSKAIVDLNSPVTGNAGTNNMGGVNLGSRTNNTLYWHGAYRKFIVRKVSDSSGNETAIYNYLKEKNTPVNPITSVTSRPKASGVHLEWTDSGTNDVEIYASVNSGAYAYVATVDNGVQYYNDTPRTVGDSITYRLYAKNGVLLSEPVSHTITVSQVVLIESVQPETIDQVSLRFAVATGKTVKLNWGDGADVTLSANGGYFTYNSNYSTANKTYEIELWGDIADVIGITCTSEPTLKVNVNEIWKFSNIQKVEFIGIYPLMTGQVDTIPSTLTYLALSPLTNSYGQPGSNQITGTDVIWPSGLTHLQVDALYGGGNYYLTFSIDDLPDNLEVLITSSGGGFPDDAITGDIANIPASMKRFLVQNAIGITWSGGPLPSGMTEFYCEKFNDPLFYGDLDDDMPSTLTKLFLVGNNAVGNSNLQGSMEGLAAACPNLSFLWITEGMAYNLTGDIGALVSSLNLIRIYKEGTKLTYGGGALPAWNNSDILIHAKLTTAEVDSWLNNYASVAGAGTKTIDLSGNNQARSSASNAAVATLEGLGRTIITN